ncbi:MAG TPA: hypothetical protein VGP25_12900 [Gemmatimonadaceae bacterium]|jgi:hypothetical protein|nr:hypothetical protein [Gemmatimonadaceae bacterium]
MSRRPFALIALSLVALAATACADATAPTSSTPSARQIQPAGKASLDVTDPDCKGGTLSSTGKAC